MRSSLWIVLALPFIHSCHQTPTACFDILPNEPIKGETVMFFNCSDHDKGYTLVYGDGTAEEGGKSHIYDRAGVFYPEIRVENGDKEDELSTELRVAKIGLKSIRVNSFKIDGKQLSYGLKYVKLTSDSSVIASGSAIRKGRFLSIAGPVSEDTISHRDVTPMSELVMNVGYYQLVIDSSSDRIVAEEVNMQLLPAFPVDLRSNEVYTDFKFVSEQYEMSVDMEFGRLYFEPAGIYPN
ncbi:MAG: hypothetical protein R2813_02780 [Flavobacteriales bacterium]